MASVFSHAFVACGLNTFYPRNPRLRRCVCFSVLLAILPDADVVGYWYGIPYAAPWGHRGATHSIAFSFLAAALVCLVFFRDCMHERIRFAGIFLILWLSGASHGLLDSITDGGLGIAFLWPFENQRFFMPYTPVAVSPIGVRAFFSEWGLRVLLSELVFIILPAGLIAATALRISRRR